MPLRLLSLVLFLTFIPHLNQLGVSSASSAPQEKLLTVAIGAFNDKLYAFAEEQFRKYIESYPYSPDIDRVYYLLGRTSYLQGKTSKANEVFHKLVHESPAFEEMGNALFWLGRTWFELGNDREAATYLKKLVFIHHENEHLSEAYYLLGYIHVQWKSFVEAEYYLREFISRPIDGNTLAQAQYWLGFIYFHQQRYVEAERELKEFARQPMSSQKPFFREALFMLSEAQLTLKQYEEARHNYRTLTRLYPKDDLSPDVLYGLGWSQYQLGDAQGAIVTYAEFKKRFSDSKLLPEVRFHLGKIYCQQEEYAKALAEFKGAVQDSHKNPLFGQSLLHMGWCYLNLGQFEEAAKVSDKILKLPGHQREKSLSQLILGEVHFHENRYLEALPYYFNLINIPEYRENALFKMAKCYFHEGKFKEALTNIEILALEYPDFMKKQELLFIRGEAASKLEDIDLAIQSYEQIIKANEAGKWRPHALFSLGKIYLLRRDLEKVKEVFHKLVEDFPSNSLCPQASLRLGTIYFNEGKLEKALDGFTLALKADDKRVLVESHFRCAEIYLKQANYPEAMKHLKAIEDGFKDQKPWYELAQFEIGNIQKQLGNTKEAKAAYKKVLEHSKDPELKGLTQKMLEELEEGEKRQ